MRRSYYNYNQLFCLFDYSTDPVAEIIIYGVESEQVEEENDALNDMRAELGKTKYIRNTR